MWTFYLLSFFFLFFLAYSQRSQIGCLPYFHTWCGLSAKLECRSEICCTRLAENRGCKNNAKNHHLRTIAQLCQAISSQLRHVLTIEKKLVKQQYLLHMSSQYAECQPTNGWDRLASFGHPASLNGLPSWLCYCTDVTQRRSTTLRTMFGCLLGWYTIYTFLEALVP